MTACWDYIWIVTFDLWLFRWMLSDVSSFPKYFVLQKEYSIRYTKNLLLQFNLYKFWKILVSVTFKRSSGYDLITLHCAFSVVTWTALAIDCCFHYFLYLSISTRRYIIPLLEIFFTPIGLLSLFLLKGYYRVLFTHPWQTLGYF